MARRKAPTEQARISVFANDELKELVDDLYTKRDFDISAPDLLGALVVAARRLPLDVVAALVPSYLKIEREEATKARGDARAPEASDD